VDEENDEILEPVKDFPSKIVDIATYKKSKYFKEDPEKLEALSNGVMYIESIMQEFVDLEGSDGMKVLMNVFDFEGDSLRNVVVRKNTEEFWNQAIAVCEQSYMDCRVCVVGNSGYWKDSINGSPHPYASYRRP
jgi:hypothetical protein